MRHAAFLLTIAVLCGTGSPRAAALQVRTLPSPIVIDRQIIVGRARCASSTWLLTDVPELTRVLVDGLTVSSSPLRGLRKGDRPWGLACLANNELWTLTAHDVLTRLEPDGRVAEHVRLDRPRLGVYGAGERLLLQQPPTGVGRPLLAAGVPGKLAGFVQWPAPIAQPSSSRDEQLKANLVNCGIGASGDVPCWLVNQARVVISDGAPAHTTVQDLRFVLTAGVDAAAPIWDVALAGARRVWVLASARGGIDGRRVGGRLTKSNRRGTDEGFVDLSPAARLILWATEDRCVLLSSTGQVLEVTER